jgi:hypothetical protein
LSSSRRQEFCGPVIATNNSTSFPQGNFGKNFRVRGRADSRACIAGKPFLGPLKKVPLRVRDLLRRIGAFD